MFRNRWVRRAVAGLLVTVVVGVAALFYVRHTTRRAGTERLAAVNARLDTTDPRWRLAEIDADRGTLPDDQNSALLVPRFKAALVGGEFQPARPGRDKRPVFTDLPPHRVLDDEGAAALDRALDGNGAALALARSFKDYPRGLRRYAYTPDYIGTLMPDLQHTRSVYAILEAESERLSRDGRPGAALALVHSILGACRSLDADPGFIGALVRMAGAGVAVRRTERVLGLGEPKGGLAELQAALLAEEAVDPFWAGLRGERAGINQLFTNMQNGTLPPGIGQALGGGPGTPSVGDELAGRVYAPHLPHDHAAYLETVTAALEVRPLPEHQQRAALRAIPIPPKAPGTLLTALVLPAFTKIHDAGLRTRAQLRCAAVGLAVERFRQREGRWPTTLAEVPKDILPTIPLDPFDGQPLKYAVRLDGVTIYSIGVDEEDDGGTILDGPRSTAPGQDIGFRLYDPDVRGLPPLPVPDRGVPEAPEGVPDTEFGPLPRHVEDAG